MEEINFFLKNPNLAETFTNKQIIEDLKYPMMKISQDEGIIYCSPIEETRLIFFNYKGNLFSDEVVAVIFLRRSISCTN